MNGQTYLMPDDREVVLAALEVLEAGAFIDEDTGALRAHQSGAPREPYKTRAEMAHHLRGRLDLDKQAAVHRFARKVQAEIEATHDLMTVNMLCLYRGLINVLGEDAEFDLPAAIRRANSRADVREDIEEAVDAEDDATRRALEEDEGLRFSLS